MRTHTDPQQHTICVVGETALARISEDLAKRYVARLGLAAQAWVSQAKRALERFVSLQVEGDD